MGLEYAANVGVDEDEIRRLVLEVLRETPGKAAEVTLVVRRGETWIVLLASRGEELAIRAEEPPGATPADLKQQLIDQVRRLF